MSSRSAQFLSVGYPVDVDVMDGVRLSSSLDGVTEDGRVVLDRPGDRHVGDDEIVFGDHELDDVGPLGRVAELGGEPLEVLGSGSTGYVVVEVGCQVAIHGGDIASIEDSRDSRGVIAAHVRTTRRW